MNKMPVPLKNILTGFTTLLIASTILVRGDFFQVVSMLAISIICTAGIGGGFWILLSYVVGAGMRHLYMFYKKGKPESAKETQINILPKEMQALVEYIQKARKQGMEDEQISNNLKSKGWKKKMVDDAFNHA